MTAIQPPKDPESVEPGADTTAESSSTAERAPNGRDGQRKRRRREWIVVIVLAIILVAAGVVVALAVSGSDGSDNSTETVRYSETFQSTEVAPLASRTLTADTRRDNKSAPTWSTPSGSFVVLDGTAAGGPTSTSTTPSLGVVQPSGMLRGLSGRLDPAESGLGLVFRYRDPKNYWSVLPMPNFGTWNIYLTVNGHSIFKGNTGFSSFGNTPIEVQLTGSTIRVKIGDDGGSRTVKSPALVGADGAGLIAFVGASSPGRCTDFAITEAR